MYSLIDGKIRFEHDRSRELDAFEESRQSKKERYELQNTNLTVTESFYGSGLTVSNTLDVIEVVGTACECSACKSGTMSGYYATCPSCAKDYLGTLEDKPIKCYCGMTYQIVKELTPVIHPLDNLMTSNIVTDINGAVTSVYSIKLR